MGEKVVDIVMGTGLAGMRLNSTDVKCLHAQVADELTRGGNPIGRQTLSDLGARGVDVAGTDACREHCDVSLPLGAARWTFRSGNNKLGQRLRKMEQRRRRGEPEDPS